LYRGRAREREREKKRMKYTDPAENFWVSRWSCFGDELNN